MEKPRRLMVVQCTAIKSNFSFFPGDKQPGIEIGKKYCVIYEDDLHFFISCHETFIHADISLCKHKNKCFGFYKDQFTVIGSIDESIWKLLYR